MTEADWISIAMATMSSSRMPHRYYLVTRAEVEAACWAALAGEIVVLTGPPRVGKTKCVREAVQLALGSMQAPIGAQLLVQVEAGNDGTSGEFSTKAFMVACLKAVNHPIYGGPSEEDPLGERYAALIQRTSEATLHEAFERALKLKGTLYLVIDEVQHVRYVRGGPSAAARILNSWKCLASRTGVKLILIGTYEILDLLALAPHLIGRQQCINFPRYREDSAEDRNEWARVLKAYSALLRFEGDGDLTQWYDLLFSTCLGRVGALFRLLRSALSHARVHKQEVLRYEAILSGTAVESQLDAVRLEVLAGEELLHRKPAGTRPFEVSGQNDRTPPGKGRGFEKKAKQNASMKESAKKSKGTKPFQRKQKRTDVGPYDNPKADKDRPRA